MSKLSIVAVAVILSGSSLSGLAYRDAQLLATTRSAVAASDAAARAAEDHDDDLADAARGVLKEYGRLQTEADRCRI